MLKLPPELTQAHAVACLELLLQGLREESGPEVVADASALRTFDSSALAVLLECRRKADVLGWRFGVVGLPPRLRVLAGLYGVAELLPEPTT